MVGLFNKWVTTGNYLIDLDVVYLLNGNVVFLRAGMYDYSVKKVIGFYLICG